MTWLWFDALWDYAKGEIMDAKICDRCDEVIKSASANVVKSWTKTANGGNAGSYDLSRDLCDPCYASFKEWISRAPAKAMPA